MQVIGEMMKNVRIIVVICGLIIAGAVSISSFIASRAPQDNGVDISKFPKEIDGWISKDVPLNKRVYELLETDNLIMRNYTNAAGQTVNLYIIYSQTNRKVAHPPELCLQGDGATITQKKAVKLTDSITATELLLDQGNNNEITLYWYKAGPKFTNDFVKQQLDMSIKILFGKKTSIAMIRLIADYKGDEQEALAMLRSFTRSLEPLLEQYLP
jgi:EpsI family protein